MASQELQTIISINARMGSGFSQVGATLQELGSLVNGTSQQIINFGKESVEVYRQYELSMRDAEVALSTIYGRNSKELDSIMTKLNAQATEWAATTIFHTDDVANAISEAAHAGWSYEQIMAGLPAAMRLAQAGNLDLSESVNYIVKSTYAAGIGFEDLTHFIDLWTYASNSSASTIGEFGDAMLRMGSTMRFVSNPEELMTLIAVTANAGSTGSAAGTMIRNSMLRLIAPTDKANKAMQQLGATTDEMMEVLGDAQLEEANAILAAHGFSAFDENGQMKSVLDIYRELYVALGDVAGGFDSIEKNQDALRILSSIFPTRTITEALTLLRGAASDYEGLYAAMMGGEADNYGQYASDTMMDTLNGKIEIFLSKAERLKQVVGEQLSDPLGDLLGDLGGFIDSIAEMDEGEMNAWIGALEVVAAAGPGLLIAGGAFRLLGMLFTPVGGATAFAIALAAVLKAVSELQKANFIDSFGEMSMDLAEITGYVDSLGAGFDEAYSYANEFSSALATSIENYRNASSTFSSTLFTKMITHATLTEEDKANLMNLGDEMYGYVEDAIFQSFSRSAEFWTAFFGGDEEALNNPMYQEIIGLTNTAYEDALNTAKGIGDKLRSYMTEAFADGQISDEEYNNILSYMRSYNEALARADAEAADEDSRARRQVMLNKAQTASYEDVVAMSTEVKTERDARKQQMQDDFEYEYALLQQRGADQDTLDGLKERQTARMLEFNAGYDQFYKELWNTTLTNFGQGDLFREAMGYMESAQNGYMSFGEAGQLIRSSNAGDQAMMKRALEMLVNDYGGTGAMTEMISYYRTQGGAENAEMANWFERMVLLYEALGGDVNGAGLLESQPEERKSKRQMSDYLADLYTNGGSQDELLEFYGNMGDEARQAWLDSVAELGETYNLREIGKAYAPKGGEYSHEVLDWLGAWAIANNKVYDPSEWTLDNYENTDLTQGAQFRSILDANRGYMNVFGSTPLRIEPNQHPEWDDEVDNLVQQGVHFNYDESTGTQSISALVKGEDALDIMTYIDGDAQELHAAIMDEDGQTILEYVDGDTTALSEAIDKYKGQTIRLFVSGVGMFAEGGRATEASIFGEGNTPEWAIPEAHTDRTAELLNAARAASGFTWPELLARFGGLNADPDHQPASIVYSPTINATDASGVEKVLKDDKRRFEQWYEDRRMREAAEVYA